MSNGNDTRGNETKQALLQAAKQLVAERGYAGTSVRELAAASGRNLAAINYHFGSRENLLNEAVLQSALEWADRIGEEPDPVDPQARGLAQLAARARPMLAGIPAGQPGFVVFLEALLQAQRSPELKRRLAEHYAEVRRRGVAFMKAAPSSSHVPDRMIEVVASYMLAVVDGFLLQSLLDPQAIPTGEELAMMYEGLAAAARAEAPDTADTGEAPDAAHLGSGSR
ncbi:MAG TPA: TetR/AcrR family transcriptional regulator [Solirubrobacteraceae bacterium]|jgi:AcrR family transcriptional regulator